MSSLRGKKILIGVTGGIAAYKTPILVRLLKKLNAEVKVVMTESAKEFVTPLTLSTTSQNPVVSSFKSDDDSTWNNHVELGLWADFFIIYPATANTLFKMANGNCDNLLIATYLSCKSKVFFSPAMDLDMYKHKSTKDSIKKLESIGNILIPPAHGELASGLVGEGRLPEPEDIINFLNSYFSKKLRLSNKNILITAGPTIEKIDPVRYISNYSSGKMGYALAEEALSLGANVSLISGPTNQSVSKEIELMKIETTDEMYKNTIKKFETSDVVIMAAAVSDFKPKIYSKNKIKKNGDYLDLRFKKTKDILSELGKRKSNQFLVGFALENKNEIENAKKKMYEKNLDLIILNSLNDKGAGFKYDTNKVTIINKSNEVFNYELKQKNQVATDIFQHIQ